MKKIKAIFFALALITAAFVAKAQEVVEHKLPKSNKVIIRLMFKNGSVTDPAGKAGLTALTASLVREGGTATMTKAQIDELVYPMAASYGTQVDKEVASFTFQVPVDFVEDFYPVITGLITTPSFTEKDFERVRSNQLEFVKNTIRNSSDEDYSKVVLEDYLYKGTPYQHMISGTAEGINNIKLQDVKDHYRKYFTKENLLIGIAGNYSSELLQRLKSDVAALPAMKAEIPKPQQAEMPEGIEVVIVSKKNAFGTAVFMGYPIEITRENDDFVPLMIANSYLGEHRKSYGQLYKKIREVRSMNYGDYSYIEWYPNGSNNMLPVSGYPRSKNYYAMWIRPVQLASGLGSQHPELEDLEVGHGPFAIKMAMREYTKLVENGMTQEEFDATRQFVRSYVKLYVSDPVQQLGYKMDSRFYNRQDWISEVDNLLEKTTLEDVNNALKKYLQTENMAIAIITSPEEAKLIAENLRSKKPSPMSYSNQLRESLTQPVFNEDKTVENFPLNVTKVTIVESAETLK